MDSLLPLKSNLKHKTAAMIFTVYVYNKKLKIRKLKIYQKASGVSFGKD